MKIRHIVSSLVVTAAASTAALSAHAYPVDPNKLPVDIQVNTATDFTLAYDSIDNRVVYYAPKTGRVATLNGMPLLSFAKFVYPGEGLMGYLSAQMEFPTIHGADRQTLLDTISAAGKIARPWPFKQTRMVPVVPGFDEEGNPICVEIEDEISGEMEEFCEPSIFTDLVYTRNGPALGENIAVTAMLNTAGAVITQQLLHGGAFLQFNLDAEYYKAGTAFTATVTVDYDKVVNDFKSYAAYHNNRCIDIEIEAFWREEMLCPGRAPADCGVWVVYKDGVTGRTIDTPTIDPDNADEQNAVFQAVEQLATKLQDEMLTPIALEGSIDPTKPEAGFKFNASFEHKYQSKKATFTFRAKNNVGLGRTTMPTAVGCIEVDDDGYVSRATGGNCPNYWADYDSVATP